MAKEEWGLKHTCPNCSTKFYDLLKEPIVCPKCGKIIIVESVVSHKLDVDEDETDLSQDSVVIGGQGQAEVEIDDSVLDDSDDDSISLDEIADMPDEEEE